MPMNPEEFSLKNLGKLSKKEIAEQEEKKAHAKWVEGFKKRKKAEEEERAEELGSLAKKETGRRAFRQELEFEKIISEKVKAAEAEERQKDIEEMRKKIEQPPKTAKSEAAAAEEPEKELTREDATLYFAKRLEKNEAELLNKFQYEAAKDSWWRRLRFRIGLNKKDKEKFDTLLARYKNTEESYLKRAREAGKEL